MFFELQNFSDLQLTLTAQLSKSCAATAGRTHALNLWTMLVGFQKKGRYKDVTVYNNMEHSGVINL